MLKEENKIFKNLYNNHGWELEKAIERDDWKKHLTIFLYCKIIGHNVIFN